MAHRNPSLLRVALHIAAHTCPGFETCQYDCVACGRIIGCDGYCDDTTCKNYKSNLDAEAVNVYRVTEGGSDGETVLGEFPLFEIIAHNAIVPFGCELTRAARAANENESRSFTIPGFTGIYYRYERIGA